MTKKCSKCKVYKSRDCFHKSKNNKDGLHYVCKCCRKTESVENRERKALQNKKYYIEKKDHILLTNKRYRDKNEESIKEQRREYRSRPEVKEHVKKKNKEYLPIKKQKIKEKRKDNLEFRLSEIIRSKYHKMISGKETSYKYVIRCDSKTLISWLEFQFDQNMTWDNLGTYWQIDHILPISKFEFKDERDKHICYNWTNLQPLTSYENRQKSNTIYLHYYMNSIINVHRFIQKTNNNMYGYQALNESLEWLRKNLGMVKIPF